MEKIFATDKLSKRERVQRTLEHRAVDRVALHDQLSYNPAVIGHYAGKKIAGFNYSNNEICAASRRALDICFPPSAPRGVGRQTRDDGFLIQNDNWTYWVVSRPFSDEAGAKDWLVRQMAAMRKNPIDGGAERARYRRRMRELQGKLGETLIFDYPVATGLCSVYSDQGLGLDLFSYFYAAYPQVFHEYMELFVGRELQRLEAIAAVVPSPVVLIAEDFATKQGPMFSPEFLRQHHYPYVRRIAAAWHEHGLKVIYHTDGNYRAAIPELMQCGVDGFYCLEPNCGMNVVELKKTWPAMIWAGGLDGVDLLERGTPGQVRAEARRQILETDVLGTGGMLLGSSSEINPPIRLDNFRAMLDAAEEARNTSF